MHSSNRIQPSSAGKKFIIFAVEKPSHCKQVARYHKTVESIMALELQQRVVLVLYYFQELKIEEIASVLNIKAGPKFRISAKADFRTFYATIACTMIKLGRLRISMIGGVQKCNISSLKIGC